MRRDLTEEEKKIEAFIRKKGVTECPGMGTKELAELHLSRDQAWRAMTPKERWQAANPIVRRGRPATLTPEERKERLRERVRNYQAANKEKLAARRREKREREKEA